VLQKQAGRLRHSRNGFSFQSVEAVFISGYKNGAVAPVDDSSTFATAPGDVLD
jgi:hypothetical protein